jgi:hypothetical protein
LNILGALNLSDIGATIIDDYESINSIGIYTDWSHIEQLI